MEFTEKLESIADPVQLENSENKNSWDDAEFVKVDRETLDVKDNAYDIQVTSAKGQKPSVVESSRELLDAEEKLKELEIELEKVAAALKASVSQNVKLKDEHKEALESSNQKLLKAENEIIDKLKSTERQLEKREKDMIEVITRNMELKSLHESSKRDFEFKMQETMTNITTKESEAKSLSEKLKILEDKVQSYEGQAGEAVIMAGYLTEELHQRTEKVYALESLNKELRRVVTEAEGQVAQLHSENQLIAETNSQLKNKVGELQEATSLQFGSHLDTITELTNQHSRSLEVHTATEARCFLAEEQLKESTDVLANKERDIKELSERVSVLERQVKVHEEVARESSGIAESRKLEIKMLKENVAKLADKEIEIKKLNTQLVALEGQMEKYEEEAQVSAGIEESRKFEIEETLGRLVKKKDQVRELNDRLTVLESQVKVHKEEFHQASGIAESRRLEIEQLQGIADRLAQKEREIEALNEKIYALESQLKACQEEATKVSIITESRGLEIEDTLLKIQDKAKIVEELQLNLCQVETRNEALAEANMKLTQDLALAETEQSDLHAKLSRARGDKDDITAQYDLSKNIIEDLTQELTSEKQRLQSEIATALEESSQHHESKKELQTIVYQLEEQLKEYKGNEDSLKVDLENLKVQISEKSSLQARPEGIKEQHQTTEAQLKDEKKKGLATVSELEASRSHTSGELAAKIREVSLLGKKGEEFDQKLQLPEAVSKNKGNENNDGTQEVEMEMRSRDIGSMELKSNKLENQSAQTSSSDLAQAPTSTINFKFILGVALVSIILGVILGKRY